MVTKVVIKDRRMTPLHYLKDLKGFPKGKTFVFKPGVNIIVGENGCGKSTLLRLIERYLMVDYMECSKGAFNWNVSALYGNLLEPESFLGGAEVYADYSNNTFKLVHKDELASNFQNRTIERGLDFNAYFSQTRASTGEGVLISLQNLFDYMFSKGTKLTFDYEQFKGRNPEYYQYIQDHKVTTEVREFTVLMDEPDRNLSLNNLKSIKAILSFHKPNIQLIAVIHNPILIVALHGNKEINFIEMTKGYISEVSRQLKNLLDIE